MTLELGFYRALVLRRLPVMALFVLLFSGLGVTTALKLPETGDDAREPHRYRQPV